MSCSLRQLIALQSVSKSFGPKTPLANVSLTISRGEKLVLIGENGCGKSTLARLLVGRQTADEGRVIVTEGVSIGYLAQDGGFHEADSLMSCGEKQQKALLQLFQEKPDLIVLDEPTNHLDDEALQWLEETLRQYRGAVVLISHDRYFLNRVADGILELCPQKHTLKYYSGNYDTFLATKQRELADEIRAYEAKKEEIASLKKEIKAHTFSSKKPAPAKDRNIMAYDRRGEKHMKGKAHIISQAKARLEELEEDELEHPLPKGYRAISFDPEPLNVAFAFHFEKGHFSASIRPHERIVIKGPNGCGKSTFLRLLLSKKAPPGGKLEWSSRAHIGYLDQEGVLEDEALQVIEYIQKRVDLPLHEIRSRLHQMRLIEETALHHRVGSLSLGQKRRLQLLELMFSKANVLVLDEPTNHLSPQLIDELEDALCAFPGVVIAATHDRRFIQKVATATWDFSTVAKEIA
ncbi:MAG TPA: ABC-F family ATP-binding cassette domain-containing protein [Chlamydiales bacterium]|nr:ABC-F family ATP-binding cassette domain-containing protein [Chlamydiales bacterium]